MAMVHCRGCGKDIHESVPTCPSCGAPQLVGKGGGANAVITSYDQVPWFRKNWFGILSVLIFAPAFTFIALTGDIYYVRKGELKTYGTITKIVFGVYGAALIVRFSWALVSGQ